MAALRGGPELLVLVEAEVRRVDNDKGRARLLKRLDGSAGEAALVGDCKGGG